MQNTANEASIESMKRKNSKAKTKKVADITHKPLGNHLEIGGFALDLVKREGDLAIFKKERIKKPWCDHYQAGYEVAIIKRHNGINYPGGVYIPPAETYPCNSLWGVLGWSCSDLDEAETKFTQVMSKLKAKQINVDEVAMETDESD